MRPTVTEHDRSADVGRRRETALDRSGRDRVASRCHDHVLDAIDDPEVAVVVERADVAGVQPAGRVERVGRRLVVVEVPHEDRGPAEQHFAPVTGRTGSIADRDLDPGHRTADRARGDSCSATTRPHAAALGEAVQLADPRSRARPTTRRARAVSAHPRRAPRAPARARAGAVPAASRANRPRAVLRRRAGTRRRGTQLCLRRPALRSPSSTRNPEPLPEAGCAEEHRRLDFAQVVLERVAALAEVHGAADRVAWATTSVARRSRTAADTRGCGRRRAGRTPRRRPPRLRRGCRCVSLTPFGLPVVPGVNTTVATPAGSSRATAACQASGSPSRSRTASRLPSASSSSKLAAGAARRRIPRGVDHEDLLERRARTNVQQLVELLLVLDDRDVARRCDGPDRPISGAGVVGKTPDGRGAETLDREVGHDPLGSVLADEQHPVAGRDAEVRERAPDRCDPCRVVAPARSRASGRAP